MECWGSGGSVEGTSGIEILCRVGVEGMTVVLWRDDEMQLFVFDRGQWVLSLLSSQMRS